MGVCSGFDEYFFMCVTCASTNNAPFFVFFSNYKVLFLQEPPGEQCWALVRIAAVSTRADGVGHPQGDRADRTGASARGPRRTAQTTGNEEWTTEWFMCQ